jgi:hypothetical protein
MRESRVTPEYSACDIDGAPDFIRISPLFQYFVAFVGMVVEAGVFLVIEVVQQADHSPQLFFFRRLGSIFAGVGAHAGLYRKPVLAQTFRLGELS